LRACFPRAPWAPFPTKNASDGVRQRGGRRTDPRRITTIGLNFSCSSSPSPWAHLDRSIAQPLVILPADIFWWPMRTYTRGCRVAESSPRSSRLTSIASASALFRARGPLPRLPAVRTNSPPCQNRRGILPHLFRQPCLGVRVRGCCVKHLNEQPVLMQYLQDERDLSIPWKASTALICIYDKVRSG